jgi:hypothetical protein
MHLSEFAAPNAYTLADDDDDADFLRQLQSVWFDHSVDLESSSRPNRRQPLVKPSRKRLFRAEGHFASELASA